MHQRATRLTSAPFRVQAPGLVCGQLYEHDRIWRVRSPVLAFLSPFGCRRSLLGHPVPSRGSASLAVGLPAAGQSTGPERGFHVPHWWDTTGVGCLLYPGAVVLTWPKSQIRPPLPPPSGGPCSPVLLSIYPEFQLTRLTEVHICSPFRPSPCLWPPDGSASPWAFSRASHPAVTSDACQERGRVLSTHPEL